MSTRQLNGCTARIVWTPNGGSETTMNLAVPLGIMRAFTPSIVESTYEWDTEDLLEGKTVTIGAGVHEVVFTDRLNNEPSQMLAMLRDARRYRTILTYIPVLSGNEYPHRVVEIMGAPLGYTTIEQDGQRFGAGDWQVSWRARRIDGGSFTSLIETNT